MKTPIMVVEDEPVLNTLLWYSLEIEGHEVEAVGIVGCARSNDQTAWPIPAPGTRE
jgi:DNA-binding response OmpR family regulator